MKDPAFLFYPGDYLRDTQCLSEKSQVAYDRIMCEHMRNICISKQQLNFFTKRLSDEEKAELLFLLTEIDGGYQITWVADSIAKRRNYSDSRRNNRKGTGKKEEKDMITYVQHMENEIENEIVIDKEEDKEGTGRKGNKAAKPEKIKFADYVHMHQSEYDKLAQEFGTEGADRMIQILDNYKGSKGKMYKDDYRAILSWVVDRYKEEKTKPSSNNGNGTFNNFKGNTGNGTFTPRNEAERRTTERRDLKELALAVLVGPKTGEH